MKFESCNRGFRRVPRLIVLPLLLTLAGCTHASETRSNWLPDKAFLQTGIAKSARSMLVGASWAPFWDLPVADGLVDVRWEAAVGRWAGDRPTPGDPTPYRSRWTTQVGLTPVWRWQPAGGAHHWFVEAGIGANIVTPIQKAQKEFQHGLQLRRPRGHRLAIRLCRAT
jgi:hypothetical protein